MQAPIPTAKSSVPQQPTMPTSPDMECALDVLAKGRAYLASIQEEEGNWEAEVVWNTMITAQYVMLAYITEQPLPEVKQKGCTQYFRLWQLDDGSWGMHADSEKGHLFVTTMVYVAMRLLGHDADCTELTKARGWLRERGGVVTIPSWGKVWLALLNLYKWEGVNPILPELWLLPDSNPVHPRRYYCHTRLIYLGIGVLYAQAFQQPMNPLLVSLREELYVEPYEEIRFSRYRHKLYADDIFAWPTALTKLGYEASRLVNGLAPKKLRAKAIQVCMDRIRFECRSTRYACISPVNGILNALALWLEDRGCEDFQKTFDKLDYWMWLDEEEGCRYTGARSQSWDTSFVVQAFCAGPAPEAWTENLEKALEYYEAHQIQRENEDYEKWYRLPALGGFCFSDREHRWPVSDCTAEALDALHHIKEVTGKTLPLERLEQAARFLMHRKNKDGGWGSYEGRRGNWFLERLNPSEMYGNCMLEHSYVECTASCIHGLRAFLDMAPNADPALRQEVEAALPKGAAYLRKAQNDDGSWTGFWGVTYTYGTYFGVMGLLRAGASPDDPAIQKAAAWLRNTQLDDGGWGERWQSLVSGEYEPSEASQVIHTSWALMTLLMAGETDQKVLAPAVALIGKRQLDNGDWPEEGVAGSFFNTAMHHYRMYRNYFPVWALGMYAVAQSQA